MTAGLAGAAVMEAFALACSLAGLPAVDFVKQLSSVTFDHSPLLSNGAALAVHLGIGVCWAVFYAFFVWGRMRAPPLVQGLVFAILPATLAIFIVYPELAMMRLHADIVRLDVRSFLAPISLPSAAGLLAGHALFGLTVGAIYRRPVGYPTDYRPSPPAPRRAHHRRARRREETRRSCRRRPGCRRGAGRRSPG